MSGVLVHALKLVPPKPCPPATWAFTSLHNFSICPRRWYLSQCHFDKFKGPLPPKLSKAGAEGELLHALLERYYDRKRNPSELFRPRQVLLDLIGNWYESNKGNLRSDAWRVRHQLAILDVLTQFRKAIDTFGDYQPDRSSRWSNSMSSDRVTGAEVWLRDHESKLIGRCDLIKDYRLVDFKSGQPHEWHRDQVFFYACLLFFKSGYLVQSAELIYLDSFEHTVFAIPSKEGLRELLDDYRAQASRADELITKGDCVAQPSEAECPKCPVRILCSDYCASEASKRLFAIQPNEGLADFVCENAEIIQESAGAVVKVTSELGTRSIFLPMSLVADVGVDCLRKMRVMNVAVQSNVDGEVDAKITSASEAFVLGD